MRKGIQEPERVEVSQSGIYCLTLVLHCKDLLTLLLARTR